MYEEPRHQTGEELAIGENQGEQAEHQTQEAKDKSRTKNFNKASLN